MRLRAWDVVGERQFGRLDWRGGVSLVGGEGLVSVGDGRGLCGMLGGCSWCGISLLGGGGSAWKIWEWIVGGRMRDGGNVDNPKLKYHIVPVGFYTT